MLTLEALEEQSDFNQIGGGFEWDGVCYKERLITSCDEATFLNKKASIKSKAIWNDTTLEKLWLYNLHYFDDLNSSDAYDRVAFHTSLVHRWINENPACAGNGWEPYTLSLRIVNFIKWASKFKYRDGRFLGSLLQQSEALMQQCEYHILANHLFANGKALTFAGVYFGPLGKSYLQRGLEILDAEFNEQFLEDGAHYELSPMYHSVMLWDVLELIELALSSEQELLLDRVESWKGIAKKGLSWLESMLHQDNEISFFNDAAIGIAPSPAKLFEYAEQLQISTERTKPEIYTHHNESGFSVINGSTYKVIINHAEIGPSYQPGHAHADSLSFEFSLMGKRVFVNSGTSMYGVSKEREAERGTSKHNTVSIENINSSEVWSGFRVARRAHSSCELLDKSADRITLNLSHDGYARINSNYIHTRKICCGASSLEIVDSIPVKNEEGVFGHYHLHPDIIVTEINDFNFRLKHKGSSDIDVLIEVDNAQVSTEKYDYHPEFGISITGTKLILKSIDSKKPFSILVKW
ncbi:heparinase II/III family protein [Pseudoalteromonas rubra]|uniref:heparinase II/III family protein n=1 Tax=Pseudoalteromonas rubra TaxID=43658 RepID=UPI00138AFB8B|nr:heparinase II/III family protein [Pseudoalteromonas rubra]